MEMIAVFAPLACLSGRRVIRQGSLVRKARNSLPALRSFLRHLPLYLCSFRSISMDLMEDKSYTSVLGEWMSSDDLSVPLGLTD